MPLQVADPAAYCEVVSTMAGLVEKAIKNSSLSLEQMQEVKSLFTGYLKEHLQISNKHVKESALTKRDNAVAMFTSSLSEAEDFKALEAIYKTGYDTINSIDLRRKPIFNTLFGKQHSNTWRKCMQLASDKGIEILSAKTKAILSDAASTNDLAEFVAELYQAQKSPLFAAHAEPSHFFSPEPTKAQKQIGVLIKDIEAALAEQLQKSNTQQI